jgi:hypothetical protein
MVWLANMIESHPLGAQARSSKTKIDLEEAKFADYLDIKTAVSCGSVTPIKHLQIVGVNDSAVGNISTTTVRRGLKPLQSQ